MSNNLEKQIIHIKIPRSYLNLTQYPTIKRKALLQKNILNPEPVYSLQSPFKLCHTLCLKHATIVCKPFIYLLRVFVYIKY